MNEFRVFSWRARPVVAVPKSPLRLRRVALDQYRAYTWRRKAWKKMLVASMLSGADSLIGEDVSEPRLYGFELNPWLDRLRGVLGEPHAQAAFFFPSQPDRGRFYATLFDSRCQPIGFAKVATSAGDPELLEAEAHALVELAGTTGRKYRVPSLIALEHTDECTVLLCEALPVSSRAYPCRDQAVPDFAISESRRHIAPAEFDKLSWWSSLHNELTDSHAAFAADLERYRTQGLDIRRAHGDFTAANMALDGETCWIYDWEHSRPDAPSTTDAVGFFLGCRSRQALATPQQVIQELRERFFRGRVESQQANAAFSLAYRLAWGSEDVRELVNYWEPIA